MLGKLDIWQHYLPIWWSSKSAAVTPLNKKEMARKEQDASENELFTFQIYVGVIISYSDAQAQVRPCFPRMSKSLQRGFISHWNKKGGGRVKAGHKTIMNLQPQDPPLLREKPVMSHVHAFKLIYLDLSNWLTGTSHRWRCGDVVGQFPEGLTPVHPQRVWSWTRSDRVNRKVQQKKRIHA